MLPAQRILSIYMVQCRVSIGTIGVIGVYRGCIGFRVQCGAAISGTNNRA